MLLGKGFLLGYKEKHTSNADADLCREWRDGQVGQIDQKPAPEVHPNGYHQVLYVLAIELYSSSRDSHVCGAAGKKDGSCVASEVLPTEAMEQLTEGEAH